LIDLHSGGEDNIFPHHECEIAQSACCYSGGRGSFASMWFHPRFLLVEGTKMSKSKGNFFTARDLFARGVEPAALRLELIRTHYRANANFTMQGLEDSARMVGRWRKVAEAHAAGPDEAALRARVHAEHPICAAFAAAMHDDLNVAQGIGAINAWLNGLGAPTAEDSAAMRAIDEVLGVLGLARGQTRETEIGVFAAGVAPDPDLEALLRERRDARARKDFATSDRIRDEFTRRGLAIKDMVGGRVEVRRA
jgi:cysteinyl-tRNA synthetase